MKKYDERHGGPYDRGSADSYYGRPPIPHYYKGDTGMSDLIEMKDMSQEEIAAYWAGYDDNEEADNFKNF